MKLVRVRFEGDEFYASVGCDGVYAVAGDVFGDFKVTDREIDLDKATVLPPVNPSKIVAVGLNYRDHAIEFGEDIPDEPKLFLKPSTAVIGHKDYIVRPDSLNRVDYEAELAIVIKKTAKTLAPISNTPTQKAISVEVTVGAFPSLLISLKLLKTVIIGL